MTGWTIRRAGPDDAVAAGRLLHDFNTEYAWPTPPPERLAVRVRELLDHGDTEICSAARGPTGSPSCASGRRSSPRAWSAIWRNSMSNPTGAGRGWAAP